MASFTFDPRTGRYRSDSGRFVSERTVRAAVDMVADHASDRAEDLARRLVAGKTIIDPAVDRAAELSRLLSAGNLTLAQWQQDMMQVVKAAHVAAGIAAHGGRAAMEGGDWGFIGQRIRAEYGYLRDFAASIADGRQPLDGRLIARARQYGQSARVSYEAVRARDDRRRGFDQERNVLHPADHCDQCRELTARDWVPIGSLPPIGSRTCKVNDRCSIQRRQGEAA